MKIQTMLLLIVFPISFNSFGASQIIKGTQAGVNILKDPEVLKNLQVENNEFSKERKNVRKLLKENPNYFGNVPNSQYKPITIIKFNTYYEQLMDVGLNPGNDLLKAIINIKRSYGFGSDLCGPGSYEYIRFYADWNQDGDFNDADEDLGMSSVNVHDILYNGISVNKQLSYAVFRKINPEKLSCPIPYCVKIRAILSWNLKPPAEKPNHFPIWGNVIERHVQIRRGFLKSRIVLPSLPKLEKLYANTNVSRLRFNASTIYKKITSTEINKIPVNELVKKYEISPKIITSFGNTSYEELKSVGLHYTLDKLVATFTVKRPIGYCGALCTSNGSYEYVGFWRYVNNSKGTYWKYLGTVKINVHDIYNIPRPGLEYAVQLPVDLDALKKECTDPRVLKVRAILSWNTPHPKNKPNSFPKWGNRRDAWIQLKPIDAVPNEEWYPNLTRIGDMALCDIDGNPFTTKTSILGPGYANGQGVYNGFEAIESPFGGKININGNIVNPPDITASQPKLRYKVQYRKSAGGTGYWNDITNDFRITVEKYTNGVFWGYETIIQKVDNYGRYAYEGDDTGPHTRKVDLMAVWNSKKAVNNDDLYELRIIVYDGPSSYIEGITAHVKTDNTKPSATLERVNNSCFFYPGDPVDVRFTASDDHIHRFDLIILPSQPGLNPVFEEQIISTLGLPGLVPPGATTPATYSINTTGLDPCGYVARLRVWDRTIVNNNRTGYWGNGRYRDVGFCILP